jgi:murein DD-endopeptidase MepM/ murein hydrolase activator NlpD
MRHFAYWSNRQNGAGCLWMETISSRERNITSLLGPCKEKMSRTFNILLVVGCLISVAAAFIFTVKPAKTTNAVVPEVESTTLPSLPTLNAKSFEQFLDTGITREIQLKTQLQDDVSYEIREYKAQSGDSLWSIAQQFNLEPETILWGNEWLSSIGVLQIGDTLEILPADGVLHTVQEGDTLETIERLHGTPAQEILEYFGNGFDLTLTPQLTVGQQIIAPNGTSPIVWSEAQAPSADTSASYSGEYPNLGTGYFVWPVAPPYLLTQEYWGGHPAIDINTYFRQPIFASDSGTVRFSGWNDTGYGNLVIIDHGNGYRTYYAHNEAKLVSAGQVVVQGQQIAESGSTGNSTGDHLDFRIYYGGSFFNPLEYLP